MDDERKSIEELAAAFEQSWANTKLPAMSATELLDLMDYYTRMGMEFEADLCRYIAERNEPNNPEVLLTQAHCLADDGDWASSAVVRTRAGVSGYDTLLFKIEHTLRIGAVEQAECTVLQSLPQQMELPDYDFLYDTAVMFRDYGYADVAVRFLAALPSTYIDYMQAQDLKIECFAMGGNYAKAKPLLNKLLDLQPFDQGLWAKMAVCCYRNGDFDEALEACEYALAIGDNTDASRIRNYVKMRQSPESRSALFEEARINQDYMFCLEYAEQLYSDQDWRGAMDAYCFANLYCPRGSRDRERILSGLSLTLFRRGAAASGLQHLKALLTYGGDYSATLFEAITILMEAGRKESAVVAGSLALSSSRGHEAGVCVQLASLLAHYECYAEARELWQKLLDCESRFPASYLQLLAEAKEKMQQ